MGRNPSSTANINKLVAQTKNLTAAQAVQKLTTDGVAEAEIRATLAKQGYEKESIDAAMATYAETAAKEADAAVTRDLTAAEATEALMQQNMTSLEAKELLIKAGIITQKEFEENATMQVTAAKLQEAVANGLISASDAEVIAGALGITLANLGEAGSYNVLTVSIAKATKAMWTFLTTTPAGWALLAAAAIFTVVKVFDALTDSVEETQEKVDSLMEEFDSAISKANDNAKNIESIADRYEELSKGVDNLGKNVSLTSDEFDEYNDLSNQIADMFPSLIKGWTDEGNVILSVKDNVDALTNSYKEAQQEAYNLLITKGEDGDGNDIITNWNNKNDPGFFASFFGDEIATNDMKSIMEDILSMSYDDYTETFKDEIASEYSYLKNVYGSFLNSELGLSKYGNTTEEEFADIKREAKALIQEYSIEIKSALNNVKSLANAYLNTNEDYSKLNDDFKTVASLIVNGINEDIANEFKDKTDVGAYVDNIITLLKDNQNNPQLVSAITELFTTDFSTLSVSDARDTIDSYISNIAKLLGEDENELKIKLGFTIYDDAEPLITKVKGFLSDSVKGLDDRVEELSLEDLKIAAELDIEIDETRKHIESSLRHLEKGGSVNLMLRPQIDTEELNKKGWDAGRGTATVFSSTYSKESDFYPERNIAINFTPIIADPETGEYLGCLTPDELQEYADGVLNGTREDDLNLQIGTEFIGEDAVKDAVLAAKDIHEYHEKYFSIDDDIISSWDELLEKIEEAKKSLEDTDTITIVDSVKQIAEQLEPQFKELADAYQNIFTEDGFTLKKVDNSMLEGLRSSFAEIEKDLGVEFDSSELEGFFAVLSNGNSTAEEVQEAFNNIATSYLHSTDVLESLNDETKISVIKQLEQMGVTNAEAIVTEALAKKEAELAAQEHYNANAKEQMKEASLENIETMLDEANVAGISANAYAKLLAQEVMLNNNSLDVNGKLQALSKIAQYAGMAAIEYDRLNTVMNGKGLKESFATENGIEVIKTKGRTTKNKDGETVEDWQYSYNGKTYESLDDAYVDKQYDELMEKLNKPVEIKFDGNSGTLGDNGGKDTKETFDWIETKLSRIQRIITNLGKTVSATYKTWGKRNNALSQEISKVTEEIATQQQGYDYYINKANSVGLSSTYKTLVQNGGIKISEISDETLKEKIQEYQEWYEKALACEDAIQDLNDELANLAKTKFDNISAEFENILSGTEHEMSMLEGYVDQAEARGNIVSTKYYSSMIDLEKNNISTLQSEYDALNNALTEAVSTGRIEKYSEEWYDMQSSINDVSKEILDANTNLIELQNTMRELEWEAFDKTQELISKVTEESDFLIDLMSNDRMYDDDGNITDQGQATLGLHAVNYNTYMAQADDYADEIMSINEKLANDPNNQDLIDRKYELIEAQRDSILAAEDEKQAMKDLMSDGYDAMLDAMSELIDKRKEAMQSIKDLYDYEKNISELNDEVTVLEKQVIAIQGDDSEEGRAQLQQIQKSLEEAQKNLEETEYEQYLSDQEKMLDALQDETETWVNERLDNIDGLIEDVIESINGDSGSIKKTLEDEVEEVGGKLSESMTNLWSTEGAAKKVVDLYGSDFSSKLTTTNDILTGIRNGVKAMLDANDIKADMDIDSTKSTNAVNNTSSNSTAPSTNTNISNSTNSNSSSNSGWGSWFIKKAFTGNKNRLNIDTSIVDRLKWKDFDSSASARASYYKAMGGTGTYTGSSKQNQWMIQQMKANGFAKGGTIGKLINKSGEDGFILARTGEEMLSLEKISAMKDVFESMNPIVKMLNSMPIYTPYNGSSGNTITNDIEMNIVLEGIHNSDEFITELKTNKKFEKFVQQITIGNAMGRNTLSKNRY